MAGDEPGLAPCGLDEEISATMLRIARERFNARREGEDGDEGDEGDEEDEGDDKFDANGDVVMKTIEAPSIPNSPRLRPQVQEYEPVPTADDETSYAILQPASRRILTKLDATLAILHHTLVAIGPSNHARRSSEDDDDDTNDATNGETETAAEPAFETEPETGPEAKTEPESEAASEAASEVASEAMSQPEQQPEPKTKKNTVRKKKGRPINPLRKPWWESCKEIPFPGETWREMYIRIAKKTKRRMPVFDDPNDPNKPGPGLAPLLPQKIETTSPPPPTTVAKSEPAGKSKSKSRSRSTSRPRSGSKSRSASRSRSPSPWRYSLAGGSRVRLRSWRDVLGAAALAGFPPSVLKRATQRCANLFGEDMTLLTIPERAHCDDPEVTAIRYIPGMSPPQSSDDEDAIEKVELEQKRSLSRHSSVPSFSQSSGIGARSGSELMSEDGVYRCPNMSCTRAQSGFSKKSYLMKHMETAHASQGMAELKVSLKSIEKARKAEMKGKTIKVVKEPLTGELTHLCVHVTCEKAVRGFSRRQNLVRHLETMHGGEGLELVRSATPGRPSMSRGGTEELREEVRGELGGKRVRKRSVWEMDVASEDEMEGAVHVDGFLKPIKMRKGWRAADVVDRTRKKGKRKIKREEEEEEEESY